MPQMIEFLNSETNEAMLVKCSEIASIMSIKEGQLTIIRTQDDREYTTYTPYRDIVALFQKESYRSAMPMRPR